MGAMKTSTGQELPVWQPNAAAPVWERARGEMVLATDGREYVDLVMGFGACLWGHGTVYERILDRYDAAQLTQGMGSGHGHHLRERATARLCEWAGRHWTGADTIACGILHTGAEAVEAAVKTAIAATGRHEFVAFEGSYHGSFGLSAICSSSSATHDPFADVLRTDVVRRAPYGEVPDLDERVACVVVEAVQGATGAVVPPDGFLEELRAACDRVGALLVLDAVLTGCGRTGGQLDGAAAGPDVIALAKALGGGMICAAVLCRGDVAERAWAGDDAPSLGTTYYAHPFSCAAVIEVIDLLERHDLGNLCRKFDRTMDEVRDRVGLDTRGTGAFHAIIAGGSGAGPELARRMLAEGYFVNVSGASNEAIALTPSVLMEEQHLDRFVDALERCVRGR